MPSETTISLLVPMSTSRNEPPRPTASTATRSAAASAPTWLAIRGPPVTRAWGFISSPISCARRTTVVPAAVPSRTAISVTERYGMWPMGLTSSPKNMSRMVELPTT